jgi:hypothetical protein
MNDSSDKDQKVPGEAEGDGGAAHGYRNEVSWDGGEGRQPYANQGAQEQDTAAAGEVEGGDLGAVAGHNIEQLEAVRGKPGRPAVEPPQRPQAASDHVEEHEGKNHHERDA